jgi:transcriptional regulator CtsR
LGRDNFIGQVAFIHDRPYKIESRLGAGGFGKINLIKKKQERSFYLFIK